MEKASGLASGRATEGTGGRREREPPPPQQASGLLISAASHIFVVVCVCHARSPKPALQSGTFRSGEFLGSTPIHPSEECDIAVKLRSLGLGNAGEERAATH